MEVVQEQMAKSTNKRKTDTVNTYERNILNKLKFVQFAGIVVIAINWLLPSNNAGWRFNVFNVVITLVWIFGILVASGYFCRNTFEEDDDLIIYEQNTTPLIVAVFLARICEIGFNYVFAKNSFNWKTLVITVVIDIIYLAIILMDKSNYGYALEKKSKKE